MSAAALHDRHGDGLIPPPGGEPLSMRSIFIGRVVGERAWKIRYVARKFSHNFPSRCRPGPGPDLPRISQIYNGSNINKIRAKVQTKPPRLGIPSSNFKLKLSVSLAAEKGVCN